MYPTNQNTLSHDTSQARELSRLLTAAVVNPEFCDLLLSNPPIALSGGYNGETFKFTPEAQKMIFSINANSLEEFASHLILGSNSGNGNGSNGNGKSKKWVTQTNVKIQVHSGQSAEIESHTRTQLRAT